MFENICHLLHDDRVEPGLRGKKLCMYVFNLLWSFIEFHLVRRSSAYGLRSRTRPTPIFPMESYRRVYKPPSSGLENLQARCSYHNKLRISKLVSCDRKLIRH